MLTKQQKMKTQTEKNLKDLQEANLAPKDPPKAPAVAKKNTDLADEFNRMVNYQGSQRGVGQAEGGVGKNKGFSVEYCGCGSTEPVHRGYCSECVKKLMERFKLLLDQLDATQDEYNDFNPDQQIKSQEKLRLMRAKAEQYNVKLTDVQMLNVLDQHSKLTNSEDNRKFAE